MIGWLFALALVVLPVDYVLIAQRPDEAGAVHVPRQAWGPCCSAFSASSVNFYHPTPRVVWVQLQVLMTARTGDDAVRLRVTNAVTGGTETYEPLGPEVVGLPRPVVWWLPVDAWNAREGEYSYSLEVTGQPTIYGAKLRVGYEGGQ